MSARVYLDWNATAPLRAEARAVMISAMDVMGNPSSVHAEGRAAKGVVEKSRAQVADLVGCEPSEIVFTSGATEAAAITSFVSEHYYPSPIEHDCLWDQRHAWLTNMRARVVASKSDGGFAVDSSGTAIWQGGELSHDHGNTFVALQKANSETGVVQSEGLDRKHRLMDVAQSIFRLPRRGTREAVLQLISGHKFGAPKGIGAIVVASDIGSEISLEAATPMRGGGQEMGRRSGTENVIGIAGFGAAAEAAARDLADGVWERVAVLRDWMEEVLLNAVPDLLVFGKNVDRLPNTSCFAVPGWKGETQVMQMDLSGYAISAGSACSSGKVKESRVLRAMGYDSLTASSAIRVSLGPVTTKAEVLGFAQTWIEQYRRWKSRNATAAE